MKIRLAGLHLQLLGLIILPLSFILLAVAIGGVQVHQNAMRQLVAERDERATRAAASAISQQLRHRDFAIRGFASRALQTAPDEALADSLFLEEDFDLGLAILDRTGRVVASSIDELIWLNRPIDQVLAQDVDGGAVFSDPFDEGGDYVVLVLAGGKEARALGAFNVSDLIQASLLNTVATGSDSLSFVTDSSGRLLQYVGDMPSASDIEGHAGVKAALRGEHGSLYQLARDGEYVIAFSPVQPTGWSLIIEEPWQSVSSPILDVSLVAPLVLVPALVVTLVGLWFGATQVIGPLRQLQDRAERTETEADSDLEEPVGGIAEIQQLQETLVEMAERLQATQQALRSYISALTGAQEEERHRIARELHDETIQDLIAIDQRIQMVAAELGDSNPGEVAKLADLRGELSHSVSEVRRLVRALRPIYLEDLGLIAALEMLAKDLESERGVPVTFQVEGDVQRLDSAVEMAIYRIAQEALNNIARHSDASSAWIHFRFEEANIYGEIGDDGKGFQPPSRPSSLAANGLFGLMGMYERADLIGASINIHSAPDEGTTVLISIPTSENGNQN